MPFKEYQEIKEKLKNWKEWVNSYALPNDKKAYFELIVTFLPFFGIYILMCFSYEFSLALTLILGLIGGLFLGRIFIIQHDCGHQSFFSSRKKNNLAGFFCSIFTLIPFKYWLRSHNHHHAHNAQLNIETRDIGDYLLLTVNEFKNLSFFKKLNYILYRSSIVMFLLGPIYYIFIYNRLYLAGLKGWKKERKSIWVTNLFLVALYGALIYLLGFKKFFIITIPPIVVFAIHAIWVFYIQHQHDPNYKAWKGEWDFLVASIKGSSYYKLPKIGHWFTGNIGYHHIHHLAPRIPFYNLAKCHHANPLFDKYVTKVSFLSGFKFALYKLWDEENQKMITFKAYYRMQKKLNPL